MDRECKDGGSGKEEGMRKRRGRHILTDYPGVRFLSWVVSPKSRIRVPAMTQAR